jgi:hypothetical protein
VRQPNSRYTYRLIRYARALTTTARAPQSQTAINAQTTAYQRYLRTRWARSGTSIGSPTVASAVPFSERIVGYPRILQASILDAADARPEAVSALDLAATEQSAGECCIRAVALHAHAANVMRDRSKINDFNLRTDLRSPCDGRLRHQPQSEAPLWLECGSNGEILYAERSRSDLQNNDLIAKPSRWFGSAFPRLNLVEQIARPSTGLHADSQNTAIHRCERNLRFRRRLGQVSKRIFYYVRRTCCFIRLRHRLFSPCELGSRRRVAEEAKRRHASHLDR